MKAKTKLIASIMSICLVCAVFAIGVFALKTANLKIGGEVSFNATGVEATISGATLTNTETPEGFKTGGTIDTSMTQADIDNSFSTWTGLDLEFDSSGEDIIFSFNIKNNATNADHYIEIDYEYSFGEENPNIDVFPGEANDYILEPNATKTTPFSLIFRVLDKELDVPETSLDITISLTHYTAVDATDWTFTPNSPNVGEAKITAFKGTLPADGVLDFPAVLKSEGNYYVVSELTVSIMGMGYMGPSQEYYPAGMKKAILHNSIKTITAMLSSKNTLLTSIDLPISLTKITGNAFRSSHLTSLKLPNSVTTISAIAENTTIKELYIPASVIKIEGISMGTPLCPDLDKIVVSPGNPVFDSRNNCNAIIETATNTLIAGSNNSIIPDDVTSIGQSAFDRCTGLTSITIPNGVTSIGAYAFWKCSDLCFIVVEEANKVYDSRENCNAIIETATNNLIVGGNITTIPTGVKKISSAFEGRTGLTSITIPESVTSIGAASFRGCTSLTSVVFEKPTGWTANRTSLDLSNPETNATYLKETYSSHMWTKA